MPHRAAGRLVAGLLLSAITLTGCSGGSDDPTGAASTSTPTPLAEVATRQISVARADFCARVAPAAVEAALGAAPASSDSWADGQRAEVADGVTDVAHEFGCVWTAPDGTAARGWVFAPPVTPGEAEALRRSALQAPGCDAVSGAADFGAHSVAVRCADATTTYHGLFGDAWLSCSLTTPGTAADPSADPTADPSALLDRTEQWCASVLEAAGA